MNNNFSNCLKKVTENYKADNCNNKVVRPSNNQDTNDDGFMQAIKKTTVDNNEYNVSYTENGARGLRTTGKHLLDLNFAVSSLRIASIDTIDTFWNEAYREDEVTAIGWLFLAGDVRGGMGERRLFKTIMNNLLYIDSDLVIKLLKYIPEYTRWDNIFAVYGEGYNEVDSKILEIVSDQLTEDMNNMMEGKSISLLGKWMPSENTYSKRSRVLARKLMKDLGCKASDYRMMLSSLRKHIDIVERKTSGNQWGEIDYSKVPSKANLLYKNAFMVHDAERRLAYLESLKKGETKINASTLYPHEIVASYNPNPYDIYSAYDTTLEELWKALPEFTEGPLGKFIVVCDTSGSMEQRVSNRSTVTCYQVAVALSIYFSERLTGSYKDQMITFSRNPKYIDLKGYKTLRDKLAKVTKYAEYSNTDIYKTFMLVLHTALANKVPGDQIPNIMIISDMEFDCGYSCLTATPDATLFESIASEYKRYGYTMPKLVFWNVCSRTGTIPVKENDNGVILVSGFSPSVINMVMSGEFDPYKAMTSMIYTDRYQPVIEVAKEYFGK